MKLQRSTLLPLAVAAVTCSIANATPTSFEARLDVASYDFSGQFPQLFERLPNTEQLEVSPGETIVLQPLDPAWGSAVQVSFSFTDIGFTRTITVVYEAIDGPFVTDAAVERLEFPEPDFGFGLGFTLGVSDSDWDGSPVERTWTLSGEGVEIRSVTTTSSTGGLTPTSITLVDEEPSPAQPGFFGGTTVIDRFEYSVRYTLVGAPSCPADVSGDGQVNLVDLNVVLAGFGQATDQGDTNGDGTVDLADLNAVLAAFGTACD
jgi:hypothetical protein